MAETAGRTTTFSVIWRLTALQPVDALAAASADPARVRAAQDYIDVTLRRYARDMGESRAPGFRLWYGDVLGVFYSIDEQAMRVEVPFAGPARRR